MTPKVLTETRCLKATQTQPNPTPTQIYTPTDTSHSLNRQIRMTETSEEDQKGPSAITRLSGLFTCGLISYLVIHNHRM